MLFRGSCWSGWSLKEFFESLQDVNAFLSSSLGKIIYGVKTKNITEAERQRTFKRWYSKLPLTYWLKKGARPYLIAGRVKVPFTKWKWKWFTSLYFALCVPFLHSLINLITNAGIIGNLLLNPHKSVIRSPPVSKHGCIRKSGTPEFTR